MMRCNPVKQEARSDVIPLLRVSAIAPSGPALAELITSEIDIRSAPVIELGAGTGVFTRALLRRGLSPDDLTIIELGADFLPMLQTRFPGARILPLDASRLGQFALFEGRPVGAVVSGLPLLSVHLWPALPGATAHPRPPGPEGDPHRPGDAQRAARGGLSHHVPGTLFAHLERFPFRRERSTALSD
jgi:phosphatidylethanolamine/phosphatidyl-N-methylethanolamine N-methyltransferase